MSDRFFDFGDELPLVSGERESLSLNGFLPDGGVSMFFYGPVEGDPGAPCIGYYRMDFETLCDFHKRIGAFIEACEARKS